MLSCRCVELNDQSSDHLIWIDEQSAALLPTCLLHLSVASPVLPGALQSPGALGGPRFQQKNLIHLGISMDFSFETQTTKRSPALVSFCQILSVFVSPSSRNSHLEIHENEAFLEFNVVVTSPRIWCPLCRLAVEVEHTDHWPWQRFQYRYRYRLRSDVCNSQPSHRMGPPR